jgi:hypothetical protein
MKKINICFWYIFNKKRYNYYEYIQSLGFDSESAYKTAKNSVSDIVDFLTKK